MRILHVICSINPKGGGPIEAVKQLGLTAIDCGHTVEVTSLDSPSASYVRDFPLPVHTLGPGKSHFQFSSRFVPWLRENAARYDVVVVNGIWQYHSYGVWLALRRLRTPYVVFTHGMLDPWFKRRYPLKHLKKWLFWPWADFRVLRDAAAVLFTAEEERLLARKSFWLYRANEIVVNFGIEEPLGDPALQLESFFGRFPRLREKRIALFMGRLHPKKGCDLAIEAFARTARDQQGWHLVMAGPDQVGWQTSLQGLVQRLDISDQVTWTGMLSGDLKWGAVRAADVFLLPSHQENFGITVAESLACGVPVLISNKVNIWREVQAFGAGLVGQDDLVGTSSLLETWLTAPESQRQQMRTQARSCFETNFEIGSANQSLQRVIDSIAGTGANCLVHA